MVQDFPEFFRGDIVELLPTSGWPRPEPGTPRLVEIEHYVPGSDSARICQSLIGGGFFMVFMETAHIRLVRRGNQFRHHFQLPLEHMSVATAINFWKDLGLATQVSNPATTWFNWTLDEAIAGLMDGIIHFTAYSYGMPGMPHDAVSFGGWCLSGAAVADRVRLRDISLAELNRHGILDRAA